jgi:hypothetical protein
MIAVESPATPHPWKDRNGADPAAKSCVSNGCLFDSVECLTADQ